MLTRIIGRRIGLAFKNRALFSGSHEGHDYHVDIDKNSPWIKYNSDPKLISIEGVQDINYPLQPPLTDNPFEHLENQPFFSFNRQVFNDPWFHEDSHQPYHSQPERGYINGEDPLETRYLFSIPAYVTVMVIFTIISLYGFADPHMKNSEATLYEQSVARRYVNNTLEEKNQKLNALKAREAELLKAMAE